MTNDPRADEVLRFWLGELATEDTPVAAEKMPIWFNRSDETDALIREQFGSLHDEAASGALDAWAETARGRLALVILLDQFSRNLFRDSPRAFEHDDRALELTLEGIRRGHDRELWVPERIFLYMPLMHTEDVAMQELGVETFRRLAEEAPAAHKGLADNSYAYMVRHKVVVERFGRFPHRNGVLGRETTPEEQAHLDKGLPF
jgi:uncharacterized protein (DUF924 family)